MTKHQRIAVLAKLGTYLAESNEELQQVIDHASSQYAWYTPESIRQAVGAWAATLTSEKLNAWLDLYDFDGNADRTVGLVLAGNIPLVGWHDIVCVLAAGFRAQVKFSSADTHLTKHLLHKLIELEPALADRIAIVERLQGFDLVIATGSNNSARYFEHYFGGKPHIIRKNRNSVAVLDGSESPAELRALGHDVFDYFGLGCRNVSKMYVPEEYDVATFFEGIASFRSVMEHHKYANNYDYNKSIYLINGDPHFDNGFLLVKPDTRTASPLAVLYSEEYRDKRALEQRLNAEAELLQCVVSRPGLDVMVPVFPFGHSQRPELDDYADGVNTLDFLARHR